MVATVGSIQIQLSADLQQVLSGFGRTGTAITGFSSRTTAALGKYDKAVTLVAASSLRATTAVRRFGSVLGTLGLGAGVLSGAALVKFSDAFTRINNQLRVSGLQGAEVGKTFKALFDIAQRNGTAIEPLVTLYGRLARSQKELGASQADLERFTDGVSSALRVQGGDASSAAGALLQLSQALGEAPCEPKNLTACSTARRRSYRPSRTGSWRRAAPSPSSGSL